VFAEEKQKKILIALLLIFALLLAYRIVTAGKPKTAPLVFTRGAVARSSVRRGLLSRSGPADPLKTFLEQRARKFPGVSRDIFRIATPAAPRKPKAPPRVVSAPVVTAPVAPVKTPEQIAEDLAREDLSQFRFLGYLTDKDNTLFLSKGGGLFMVKVGDRLYKNYRVKQAGKDFVVLVDAATGVEVSVELSGNGQAQPQQQEERKQRPSLLPGQWRK
jgi:hypothetical protein